MALVDLGLLTTSVAPPLCPGLTPQSLTLQVNIVSQWMFLRPSHESRGVALELREQERSSRACTHQLRGTRAICHCRVQYAMNNFRLIN